MQIFFVEIASWVIYVTDQFNHLLREVIIGNGFKVVLLEPARKRDYLALWPVLVAAFLR